MDFLPGFAFKNKGHEEEFELFLQSVELLEGADQVFAPRARGTSANGEDAPHHEPSDSALEKAVENMLEEQLVKTAVPHEDACLCPWATSSWSS